MCIFDRYHFYVHVILICFQYSWHQRFFNIWNLVLYLNFSISSLTITTISGPTGGVQSQTNTLNFLPAALADVHRTSPSSPD